MMGNSDFSALLGVALVIAGAILMIVGFLKGWTESNLFLLLGLAVIILGVVLHVKLAKRGEKY